MILFVPEVDIYSGTDYGKVLYVLKQLRNMGKAVMAPDRYGWYVYVDNPTDVPPDLLPSVVPLLPEAT